MIELLLPYGFDTLEYSWVKVTIGICTLADYSGAKKCQHAALFTAGSGSHSLGVSWGGGEVHHQDSLHPE
jgi:hypothetical protein